jgi:3-hydroxymyristoyl/3-hydroxydecanoyl-(acyl carrier protein) dehydratase
VSGPDDPHPNREVVRAYDARALESLLPHRYPFLLVDRIEVIEPGQRVVGSKRLTSTEWWTDAPAPIAMPFPLVLEALAQTGGALISDLPGSTTGVVAYFLGADRVRYRRPVRAGDELRLDVSLRQWRRGVCRTRGVATVDGQVVLTAELTTIVRG